jgi:hypothetical protein
MTRPDKINSYEILRLGHQWGVAKKHLEIEATFDTKYGAIAYANLEGNQLALDSIDHANSIETLLERKKGSRFANLIKTALTTSTYSAGKLSSESKKLVAKALLLLSDEYVVSQLKSLNEREIAALSSLQIHNTILDWLVFIGSRPEKIASDTFEWTQLRDGHRTDA